MILTQILSKQQWDHIMQNTFDFEVNITLEDDTIQEPEEYFLLVLDVQQSDASKDKITVDAERRCLRVHIAQSLEGELSLIAHTRNKVS